MAIQKVWNEDLQEWVYDDPDLPEGIDIDDDVFVCEGVQWKQFGSDKLMDLKKATLPVSLLEELSHATKNK